MEPWRLQWSRGGSNGVSNGAVRACCRPVFAGSHHFGGELDPGPDSITHKSEKREIHIRIRNSA